MVNAGAASLQPELEAYRRDDPERLGEGGRESEDCLLRVGRIPLRMRKGEHDSALFGWMSDNGDPDNFADVLLGCDSIETGSNAARWCDKTYDGLVKKAKLTSVPEDRAKLYSQAQEVFYQQAPWIALANGKTFYATRSNVTGYSVSLMGSDFSKAKLN